MTAPVDVLAVMDKLTGRYIANKGTDSQFISCITPQCFGTDAKLRESDIGAAWLDLDEARAAVAELIAEAQAVLDHVEDEDAERVGNQCTLCYSYRARLRAALTRAVGGK